MSRAEDTAVHPTLAGRQIQHADAPVRRHREPSGTIGEATASLLDQFLGDKIGASLDEKAREATRKVMAEMIDAAANARGDAPVTARASVPWVIALTAVLVCLAGAIGVTYDRVRTLEARANSSESYDRAMAQWLVISQENDHLALVGLDKMLRALAINNGISVDDIEPPRESDPPTAVQLRALEATTP